MRTIRALLVFALLIFLKVVSRLFYRHQLTWLSDPPRRWQDVRILAGLNHTSLYEPLYAGSIPVGLLWSFARHGVLPIADKTAQRPMVGRFFKLLSQDVIDITRQRDETWRRLLTLIRPRSVVVIFPEGRMKRRNGLDKDGKPMTVRGGIADLLRAIPNGTFLIAYSGGLHHVQVPGQLLPKPFRTLRLALQAVDIETYRAELLKAHGEDGFRAAVIADLEARRDRLCPRAPGTDSLPELNAAAAPSTPSP
jgi:1-acyl-sn-glycerol-3-phosphate acyltransferase